MEWARRKRNVVERFHRSSFAIGLEMAERRTSLEARYGLATADYASHGGAFPIAIAGSGIIGCVVVSGLPQREDHMVVVRALCSVQRRDATPFELAPG